VYVRLRVHVCVFACFQQVQCLEEERLQGEQVQAKYQTIIQNQKSDNAGLCKQLSDFQALQEDFDRYGLDFFNCEIERKVSMKKNWVVLSWCSLFSGGKQ